MAIMTMTKDTELIGSIRLQIRPYEDFQLLHECPASHGYIMALKTNTMVHRVHTTSSLFKPNSVYIGASLSAMPNLSFVEAWLIKARMSTEKFINKGDYTEEIIVGGEWQTMKRKFNRWVYFDRNSQMKVGRVQTCPK